MREQVAERDARMRGGRSTVLAVVSGNGMSAMFRGSRRRDVDGGADAQPLDRRPRRAIDHASAEGVVLLPNSPNVRMAAEEAAELAEKEVAVVDCDSQQAALAALPEADPEASAAENAERLAAALGRIRSGGVAPAVKDDPQGRFVRGDAVGFAGEEVVAWGGAGSTLRKTLDHLGDGAELVTVLATPDAPMDPDEVPSELDGGAEVEVHPAGQPGWWWLITAE